MRYYLPQIHKHTPNLPLYALCNAFLLRVRSDPSTPCALYLLLNQLQKKKKKILLILWDCLEKLWDPPSSETGSVPLFPISEKALVTETGKLFKEILIFYYLLDSIQAPRLVNATSPKCLRYAPFSSPTPFSSLSLQSSPHFQLFPLLSLPSLPPEWSFWNLYPLNMA